MKLKPLGDRIIVKPIKEEEITASGIILPDTAEKEQKSEGEIVAVGDGERIINLGLKPGMKVIYGKYGGEEFKEDDIEYKILSVAKEEDKSDVFAIIE
ncbi:MAG: co-chaperone GroES [Candidatus Kerfeldbacteria bacterium CG_4_10_14_0_8_um_filter_42_10]|uniref:Co-chaperonin GroES n=1 Tax=Candidatus Kerfeldbacteria bacterium CG_4_10_14_0_8_um_filter_42_10 TaxID=2014248 RepID=A0A2M7RK83_9BACT|nr:MAG: co-chaperone GroES [Candidatus Kerfeldbacteria bacterium CG_4_10_14_0_8_um_filter_42_10]